VISVAPCHIIPVLDPAYARVVFVVAAYFGIIRFKGDDGILNAPGVAVVAEARVNVHVPRFVIAAKHAGEPPLEGNDGGVEYAVGARNGIPPNHWIFAVAPNNASFVFGFFLPWDVW
jgi:hypothetical protein